MKFERGSTKLAREIAENWVKNNFSKSASKINLGLPEYDDRLDCWRVTIHAKNSKRDLIGEIKISRDLKTILDHTKKSIITERIVKINHDVDKVEKINTSKKFFFPAPIPNKVIWGDSIKVLEDFPPDTAQLIVTSPPYYNAKPEYSEYVDYQEYLDFLRRIFVRCHNILSEGRFIVVNVSPVIIKRTSRKEASKRIPIPFDIHKILDNVGFEFIDDIQWVKPEGAGWNIGRGRRFAADRKPLQYKPVPVTENVMVYRKKTDKLIDWNLRNHYNPEFIERAKILGEYDRTNIWNIHPSYSKIHPATFPEELVERIIRYYSFIDDLVLDPFGGSGTVARVALRMQRRFISVDNEEKYFQYTKQTLKKLVPESVRVDFDVHDEFKEEENEL